METKNMTQERISALLDNELPDEQLNLAFAALRQAEGLAAWDVYHQIGDVLRSDDMAHEFSSDFNARLMARLEAEPTIVAPQPQMQPQLQPMAAAGGARTRALRRFAAPTAVAAVAVLALMNSPQLLVALKGGGAKEPIAIGTTVARNAPGSPLLQVAMGDNSVSAPTQNGVVLRDPRIDEYLLAHQRFSPAWNSTAQYARSATFASDSDK
jgi:sigma-E factor negative regulatory protein RseA